MSISDTLMWRYFELLSFKSNTEIENLKKSVASGSNPRDVKFQLAEEIITRFHNQSAANEAKENFISQFQKNAIPNDIQERKIQVNTHGILISHLLKQLDLCTSTSEANRSIEQGAVRIDGNKIDDKSLVLKSGVTHVIQIGKRRFAKVIIQ